MKQRRAGLLLFLALGLLHLPTSAVAETIHISSGTGFFVSNQGHIVTNEHVVRGCTRITVQGTVQKHDVRLITSDKQRDLALLGSNQSPLRVPTFRQDSSSIVAGEKAVVIGYPMESGLSGKYVVKPTSIVDTRGPLGQEEWLQFSTSVDQGNSGGPLLDSGGNIIGVVVGKATLSIYNSLAARQEVQKHSDIAISLESLKKFLSSARVPFRTGGSSGGLSANSVENIARQFVVSVHCQQ